MPEVVIEVKDLDKMYRLGTIGTGTFRRDLQRWWTTSILKKSDPYFQSPDGENPDQETILALNNVSFEVKKGEVIGIIGSNGSGKSTLLKVISRITKPTNGTVRGKGKISSLLEVGTGFHQDLTGRENIYLSGYILGMNKWEIKQKFDDIVAFSGIEGFIDTPVKRYSSGMYVRLAFAVAAHLEPDILIVDEVLAVGDADFQKKCLGKMREVSEEKGRTILFVSHSMQAIKNLCDKALWLKKGQMKAFGNVSDIVTNYLSNVQQAKLRQQWKTPDTAPGNEWVRMKSVELIPHLHDPAEPLDIRTPLTVKFQFWNLSDDILLSAGLHLFTSSGECIFDVPSPSTHFDKGIIEGKCNIPGDFLNDGAYYFSMVIVRDTSVPLFRLEECLTFELEDYRENIQWYGKWWGAVRPKLPFHLKQAELVLDEAFRSSEK
jgi:lipopolysaccharide transport system ATP-binding protein